MAPNDAASLALALRALRERHGARLSAAEAGALDAAAEALRGRGREAAWWERAERAVRMAESLARLGGLLGGWG